MVAEDQGFTRLLRLMSRLDFLAGMPRIELMDTQLTISIGSNRESSPFWLKNDSFITYSSAIWLSY
jgi:hypothetical protein